MTPRWHVISLGTCAFLIACEAQQQPVSGNAESESARLGPESPSVVFAVPEFVIDRIGVPVLPPTTVGSLSSPTTVLSEAPLIVSVDPSGALVGHRNGRALVRAVSTGSVLTVLVAAIEWIRITPGRVRLEPGKQAQLHITGSDGTQVPGSAASWATTAPAVASVWRGTLRAGRTTGRTLVGAIYGGQSAYVEVEVVAAAVPSFAVRPGRPTLRVGQMVSFNALSPAGPIDAQWSTSNARVAMQIAGSLFRGAAPGSAAVCAATGDRRSCTSVEVVP